MRDREIIREILTELRAAQDANTYHGKGYVDLRPFEDQLVTVVNESAIRAVKTTLKTVLKPE